MTATAMNTRADACPDIETIAAFLDARLDERQRETVAGHLASCDKCYFIFTEAAQVRPSDAEPAPAPVVWWKRREVRWSAAAGLAAAATLVLALRVMPVRGGDSEPVLEDLVAAVGTERLIEPRLTVGFAYGPMREPVRSGQGRALSLSPDIRIAAARIEKETTSQYSAAAFHARGIAALVTGDFDRAVTAFEAAAAEQPNDARVLSDLAAAYLVRGERRGSKDDTQKALAALNRAVTIDRLLAEALFNRAYTFERLLLTTEARDAWQSYLAIDGRSPWADEARHHLRQLSPQP